MVYCKVRGIDVPRHCGHCSEFRNALEKEQREDQPFGHVLREHGL